MRRDLPAPLLQSAPICVIRALPPMPTSLAPTRRFSDRVENYTRHRPSYPAGVIDTLRHHAGLTPAAVVADIGSGTGIFSRILLPRCAKVFGVEPNDAMRQEAERLLAGDARFSSVPGAAEATGLPDASVDLVTSAQAFHWFDPSLARREFLRILRPGGFVALVWNERLVHATPFLSDYEALLARHAADSAQVRQTRLKPSALAGFYGPGGFATAEFPSGQRFDFEGLKGRLLSSSCAPNVGHPGHEAMIADLADLYARHAREGFVSLLYTTKVHYGRLS